MTVNRKQFLGLVATGVAGAAAWKPGRLLAETVQSGYSTAMFTKYLGTSFRVTSREGSQTRLDMVLHAILERASGADTAQFSLEFVAPAGEPIASRTYNFDHPDLGTIPLFVTLTRRDSQWNSYYRADFNILQNTRSTPIVPPRYKR